MGLFDDFKSELTNSKKPDCKGLYWRGIVNLFADANGRIKQSKEVRLLKRKSCPGCEKCSWVFDFIVEDIFCVPKQNILTNIEHGKIYTYQVNTSRDWESGITEIDNLYFVEVKL
jgi:hypothetical protein